MKVLLFGATGWIGGKLLQLLRSLENDHEIIVAKSRLDDYSSVINEVLSTKPSHVLNCAGLTGRPNVDWCEDHKEEVLRVNVTGTSVLAEMCSRHQIHFTFLSTGCIYSYDESHPINDLSKGFTEEDHPNFDGSFYSYTKIIIENIVKNLSGSLILRIRMPISDDLHPRNFVTKITKYQNVVNIPNSMSVLYDLLPVIPDMMIKEKTGIYNFTNPGAISHNEILTMYKEIIDPEFTWSNFSLEEQAKVIKAPRSNNYLDASKLLNEYPSIPEVRQAVRDCFLRMKNNL